MYQKTEVSHTILAASCSVRCIS